MEGVVVKEKPPKAILAGVTTAAEDVVAILIGALKMLDAGAATENVTLLLGVPNKLLPAVVLLLSIIVLLRSTVEATGVANMPGAPLVVALCWGGVPKML